MRLARPLILSVVVALAMAIAAPPAAQAATLEPLRPCYRSVDATNQEPVHVEARACPHCQRAIAPLLEA